MVQRPFERTRSRRECFIHLDEDVPYKVFYKVIHSIYATYTTTIQFAIGNNNKEIFQMPYFTMQSCSPIVEGLFTASIRLRLKGISNEVSKQMDELNSDIENQKDSKCESTGSNTIKEL